MKMDSSIVTDAQADLQPQPVPNLRNEEKSKIEEKSNSVVEPVKKLDEFVENVKGRISVEDFYKAKLLSRSWFGRKKMKNVNTFEQLVIALKAKYQDHNQVFFTLIEILYTLQRFDLLKLGNSCKHNARECIRNHLSPEWTKWYDIIESLDPLNKSEVVKKLGQSLVKEDNYTTQQCLLDSLDELFDKTVVLDLERYLLQNKPPYLMNTSPCGQCVIINNRKFSNSASYPDRLGTDVDRDNLKSVWENFGFKVEVYEDQKAAQIKGILLHLSRMDHSKYSCLVVCILTHGEEDVILGTDCAKLSIGKDIIPMFYSVVNPTLIGKPKLFFIQACQGGKKMNAVLEAVESDARAFPEGNMDDKEIQSDAPSSHPQRADDFIFMATAEGFAAYRSKVEGSWFITKLVRCLDLMGDTTDLQEVTRMVIAEVAEAETVIEGKRCKQMPIVKTTLRKTLVFKKH